jgi:hypothetical protein
MFYFLIVVCQMSASACYVEHSPLIYQSMQECIKGSAIHFQNTAKTRPKVGAEYRASIECKVARTL